MKRRKGFEAVSISKYSKMSSPKKPSRVLAYNNKQLRNYPPCSRISFRGCIELSMIRFFLAVMQNGILFTRVWVNAGNLPFLVSSDLRIMKENLISFVQLLIIF
jgi:hypothetical protein